MENLPPGDTAPNKTLFTGPDPNDDPLALGDTLPTQIQPSSGEPNDRFPDSSAGSFPTETAVVIGDTSPIKVIPFGTKKKNKPHRWPWVVVGLLLLVIGAGIGGYYGYQEGIRIRLSRQATQIAVAAKTQFDLGNKDLADGKYESARKRFEYVAQLDPGFPGITQKLTQVMVILTHTEVPTAAPTQTRVVVVTPTPDTRGVADLIKQAQDNLRNKDWDGAIATLDNLRTVDPLYRAVDVDGMYYIALRFRGMDKILKNGNLEGGSYDLAQAESFAPIDHDADAYRTWSTLYLQGAAYWGIDWLKVIENFGNIVQSLPSLRDGSNMTATERYRIALLRYGDQLAAAEDWCGAQHQYSAAQAVSEVQTVKSTLAYAKNQCSPPTPKPTKTKKVQATSEPPPEQVTDIPTVEIPAEIPTETPIPSP